MKIYKIKLLFLSVCLTTIYVSGQNTNKDIQELPLDVEYTQIEVDSIIKKIKSLEDLYVLKKILNKNKDLQGWTYYYRSKSTQTHLEGKFDSTIVYGIRAIESYKNTKNKRAVDEEHLVKVYYNIGRAFYDLKRYEESIIHTQKALDLHQKHPYKWVSFITASMANAHLGIGHDSIAFSYYQETTRDSLYMTLRRPAVTTYTRMGYLHRKFKNIDSAKYYYRKGVELSKKTGYISNLYALYFDIGDIFKKDGKKDSTLYYYRKAVEAQKLSPGADKNAGKLIMYIQSYIDFQNNKRQRALESLLSLKKSFLKQNKVDKSDKEILQKVLNLLKEIYVANNDIDELKSLYDEQEKFLEGFYEDQLSLNFSNLEIKYQTKEKDASIANLEASNKQQEVILRQQGIINWILGVLLLSIAGIGVLFFKQRKQKEKFKTANLEQRLLRSQLNPHFLFNALNTASSLAHQNSRETTTYISKLGNLLRSVLENSREEFISLEEEIDTLTNYLELQSDFSKKFTYKIEVSSNLDEQEILIPPMFIQPFIENAIQHGFRGNENEEIVVQIKPKNETKNLQVVIENNGRAYSKTLMQPKMDEHNSLSGKILKERLAIYAKSYQTKSYYTIKDLVDGVSGTKVDLYLPLVKDI